MDLEPTRDVIEMSLELQALVRLYYHIGPPFPVTSDDQVSEIRRLNIRLDIGAWFCRKLANIALNLNLIIENIVVPELNILVENIIDIYLCGRDTSRNTCRTSLDDHLNINSL